MLTLNDVLTRGIAEILPDKEGLMHLMESGKIKLYQGFDPSMPSLHLGNMVGIMKLRQLQNLGHKVIFLIGDFTGMIGDPTDKQATRKQLTREEVNENAKNWKDQIKNVLDFEGDNPVELLHNSEWHDKLTFKELIDIASNFTVQQMTERDMFQERLKGSKPIYLHEFLYPVAQGYDSLVMDVDLEIGGSDQIFNMLSGRTLVKAVKDKEKYVLATKLLVDKDGQKIGKTTSNALFLSSGPEQFYGGIMSFPDETIALGFELLTEVDLGGIEEKIKQNPMSEKKRLAYEVVKLIWGEESATSAQKAFTQTFQEDKPDFKVETNAQGTLAETIAPFTSLASISEAKRLILASSVDVNTLTVSDPLYKPKTGDEIKIGKKIFLRIK